MEKTFFLFYLCADVQGRIGKHVYVSEIMTWAAAQNYCRQHYTELSFIDSQSDQDKFQSDVGEIKTVQWYNQQIGGWIGLHRDPSNMTAWKWSGGGYTTYLNWAKGQPDNYGNTPNSAHLMSNGKWDDFQETIPLPFYCINITVVKMKMTWEGALEHCRETDTDLTSLLSETERLMAQKEIQEDSITERVWIGLRYLEDRWMWVNRDPLVYQAWPQGDQDHQCPIWTRCGVLTKLGVWENRDCQEELYFICS